MKTQDFETARLLKAAAAAARSSRISFGQKIRLQNWYKTEAERLEMSVRRDREAKANVARSTFLRSKGQFGQFGAYSA